MVRMISKVCILTFGKDTASLDNNIVSTYSDSAHSNLI